jgi:hypothetical protein
MKTPTAFVALLQLETKQDDDGSFVLIIVVDLK